MSDINISEILVAVVVVVIALSLCMYVYMYIWYSSSDAPMVMVLVVRPCLTADALNHPIKIGRKPAVDNSETFRGKVFIKAFRLCCKR